MMTPQELADKLDGIQYPCNDMGEYASLAKEHRLVIFYGMSDDLLEARGFVDDEAGAWDGCNARFCPNGFLDINEDDEIGECELDQISSISDIRKLLKRFDESFQVKAEWCPPDSSASWAISVTGIEQDRIATFNVMEDDDLYCEGVVVKIPDGWSVRS